MAIAGIILSASAAACAGLEKALQGREGILDVQRTPDGADIGGLVVVVEQPSDKIQKELMTLRELPEVDDLHRRHAGAGAGDGESGKQAGETK